MQITPSDEFFDLNGGHIRILQPFYYKNQQKNLLNLSYQHFLASGLGCCAKVEGEFAEEAVLISIEVALNLLSGRLSDCPLFQL